MDNLYDDMGQLTPQAEEAMQAEAVERALIDGEKLISLEKHPGWLLVKAAVEATIQKEKDTLLYARTIDLVTKLQESIRARQELLSFIAIKIAEAKHLIEEPKTQAQA